MSRLLKQLKNIWQHFKENIALWVGVSSIIFGAIGTYVSVSSFQDATRTDKLLNRPYLEIAVLVPTFYNSEKISMDKEISLNAVKYFTLKTQIKNFGKLPAKITRLAASTTPAIFSFDKPTSVVVYSEIPLETEYFPIELLKLQNEFMVRQEIEYKLMDDTHVYTAYVVTKCDTEKIHLNLQIRCYAQEKGGN